MTGLFKRYSHALGLFAAALLLSACAITPKTFSNQSPLADFSQYQTYNFATSLGTDRKSDVRSLLSQYLLSEINQQMQARGYSYSSDTADLQLNFDLATQEKLRSTPSASLGGYYGHGGYPGYGYYGGYGDSYRITQYTEGTLSISMADTNSQQVVWEGISISRITDDVRENLGAAVKEAVTEMFAQFPYYAAGSEPPALAKNGQ